MRSIHGLGLRRMAVEAVSVSFRIFVVASLCSQPVLAQAPAAGGASVRIDSDASVESLFKDFVHYAKLGRFTLSDAYAQALLAHKELNAGDVMRVANADRASLETLIILIENSTIGDNAARVLKLVYEGEHEERQNSAQIRRNIQKLAGTPQEYLYARDQLIASGEFAIPHVLDALLDGGQSRVWPRLIASIPSIGKVAVNPLLAATSMQRNDVRLQVIKALGEIGYPQAIPYLLELSDTAEVPQQIRDAARDAVARIETITGRAYPGDAVEHYVRLAEKHFEEHTDVQADPRLDTANVWQWDESEQALTAVAVPQRIFGSVMSMRCAQRAMALENDRADAIALWLAGNIRREHRLGMNVESGDPTETGEVDPSIEDGFPRALYFTQAAGPRYAHLVLQRAVNDGDAAVALGAITALSVTAGETSLVGREDYKQPLVEALRFPDTLVRLRAALALGAALPKSPFADSQYVVPTLAGALALTGSEQIVVVDPDQGNLNRVAAALRAGNRQVIGEPGLFKAMDRARQEFQHVSLIVLAADVADPPLSRAMSELRREFTYGMTPVVILSKSGFDLDVSRIVDRDGFSASVDAGADEVALARAMERALQRSGGTAIDPDRANQLALASVDALRAIAVDGRTVFDFGRAERALTEALASDKEPLQTKAASVLALARTPSAQRAVAGLALDSGQADGLRVSVFGSLAESAKSNGNLLSREQVDKLIDVAANEPDLTLRTAASKALGALNLATNQASEIIRSFR